MRVSPTATDVLVVVVDDRSSEIATELRAGLGAAVKKIGGGILSELYFRLPDHASWHPVDVRVVLVPASSSEMQAVASPATNSALAWTSNQAITAGRDGLVRAVEAEMERMTPRPAAMFRPLERAAAMVELLIGERAPADDVEAALFASTLSQRSSRWVGVSVLAATDDESPEPVASYRIKGEPFEVPTNVVTREGRGEGAPDDARYPRLAAWARGTSGSFGNCFEFDHEESPFERFHHGLCAARRSNCDERPIAQISPGVGACQIGITTVDPPSCEASRGWLDPAGADGVRRPRMNDRGEQVCEVAPVDPAVMDACIHDETCADCSSGWCVTEVMSRPERCPHSEPMHLRWVGGVFPDPGLVSVTCLEPNAGTH